MILIYWLIILVTLLDLHKSMLTCGKDSGDEDFFLVTLASFLADTDDELSEEEIERLPIDLQYYTKHRTNDQHLIQRAIQTLYQVYIFQYKY